MVRLSVLEVFYYAYDAAVVVICQYIVGAYMNLHPGTPSRLVRQHFPQCVMCSLCPLITRPYHFNRLSWSFWKPAPFSLSLVCVRSYLEFACHPIHTIHHSLLIPFTSIRFSCRFIAEHGSVPYRNAQHSAAFLPIATTCSHSICDFRIHTTFLFYTCPDVDFYLKRVTLSNYITVLSERV